MKPDGTAESGEQGGEARGQARHGSSEDFVYTTLRDAITDGELKPGDRVTEKQLAERLNVSRTPVRAAIRLLEEQRLLERRAGVGLVVTDMSFEQLDDIYTTRSVLIGLAARLAAHRMTSRDHLKLQALQDELEALSEAQAFQKLAVVNDVFHDEIVRASGNESLQSLLGQIHLSIIRFRHSTHMYPGRAAQAMDEHRALIAALVARDEVEAERIARDHVMNAHYARLKQQAEREIERFREEAVRTT